LEEVVGDKITDFNSTTKQITSSLDDLAVGFKLSNSIAEFKSSTGQLSRRYGITSSRLVNLAMAHRTLGELSSAENNSGSNRLTYAFRGSDHPDTLAVMGAAGGYAIYERRPRPSFRQGL
jgi:hypothetical protein